MPEDTFEWFWTLLGVLVLIVCAFGTYTLCRAMIMHQDPKVVCEQAK